MGDVIITKGVIARNDGDDASVITTEGSASASNLAVTSDRDILKFTGTLTAPLSGDFARAFQALTGGNTDSYPRVIIRHKQDSLFAAQYDLKLYIRFSDATEQEVLLTQSTTMAVVKATLTAGKTISRLGLMVKTNAAGAPTGSFVVYWDFIFQYERDVTLPVASSIEFVFPVRIAATHVPFREGTVLQPTGTESQEIDIVGTLVADAGGTLAQYSQYLMDLAFEHKWQWINTDLLSAKFLIRDPKISVVGGPDLMRPFTMRIEKFDLISATSSGGANI